MKNKFMCVLLCLTLCISAAACKSTKKDPFTEESSVTSVESEEESQTSETSETESEASEVSGDGQSAAASSKAATTTSSKASYGSVAPPSIDKAPKYSTIKTSIGTQMAKIDSVKGKEITLLCVDYGQFDPTGTAYKFLKDYYGITIKQTRVAGDKVISSFTTASISGKPYDLVADCDGFPSLVAQDMMAALDNAIDFTIPEIAKLKTTYDSYTYRGQHYFLPWVQNHRAYVYYNKEIFDDANLDIDGDGKKGDTPESLFQSGKWTYDTLKNAATKLTKKNSQGKITLYGLMNRAWTDAQLAYSSGQPLVKESGGKLISNLENSGYQRIYNLMADLYNNQKVISRGNDLIYKDFNTGNGAMLIAPDFCSRGVYFKDIFKAQNVGFVPIPKDSGADKYYVPGSSIGFFVSKGGMQKDKKLDVDCLNAFINATLISELEKGMKGSVSYQSEKDNFLKEWAPQNKKFTEKWYDDFMAYPKTFDSKVTKYIDPYVNLLNLNEHIWEPMIGIGQVDTPKTFVEMSKQKNSIIVTALDGLKK